MHVSGTFEQDHLTQEAWAGWVYSYVKTSHPICQPKLSGSFEEKENTRHAQSGGKSALKQHIIALEVHELEKKIKHLTVFT